jgi:hypothetical protein
MRAAVRTGTTVKLRLKIVCLRMFACRSRWASIRAKS